jgi:hypothetical protein
MSKVKIKIENKSEPKKKTTSEIRFLENLEIKNRQDLKRKVGDFIKESVLDAVGGASSPLEGGDWPALGSTSKSGSYKKFKKGKGAVKANMELSGDMLDAYDYKLTTEGVELGVFGKKQGEKADGHNKLTGRSNPTPKRRFIPGDKDKFNETITEGIESLVAEHIVEKENIKRSDLVNLTSKSAFDDFVKATFPDITLIEAKQAIKNTPSIFEMLDELGLIGFLV